RLPQEAVIGDDQAPVRSERAARGFERLLDIIDAAEDVAQDHEVERTPRHGAALDVAGDELQIRMAFPRDVDRGLRDVDADAVRGIGGREEVTECASELEHLRLRYDQA